MLTELMVDDLILKEDKILNLDPHDNQDDGHSNAGHDSTDCQTDDDDEIQQLSLLESLMFLLVESMLKVAHMMMMLMMTDQHILHQCMSQALTQTLLLARLPDKRDIHENNSDIDILVDDHDIIISRVTVHQG